MTMPRHLEEDFENDLYRDPESIEAALSMHDQLLAGTFYENEAAALQALRRK